MATPKLMIGYQNLIFASTLNDVNNRSPSGLGITNLQSDVGSPADSWWITGAQAITFVINLPANSTIRCLGLFNTNFGPGSLQAYYYDASGNQVGSTAISFTGANGQVLLMLGADVVCSSVTIGIQLTSYPDGYLRIGQCYIGPMFSPVFNYTYKSKFGRKDQSVVSTSSSGQQLARVQYIHRTWTADLTNILKPDLAAFRAIDYQSRLKQNLLWIPSPTATDLSTEAIFGLLTSSDDFGITGYLTRSWSFTIEERG